MAYIEALLASRVTTTTAVSSLIGTRFYPNEMPQTVTYPAARYTLVVRPEVLAKPSSPTLRIVRARFQIDVYATTYAQAKAVAAAIKGSLYGWVDLQNGVIGARITDESDITDNDEAMRRVSIDGSITYNE